MVTPRNFCVLGQEESQSIQAQDNDLKESHPGDGRQSVPDNTQSEYYVG